MATASSTPAGASHTDVLYASRVVLFAMTTLAELRESDTESHLLRVRNYVQLLTQRLQTHPDHAATLTLQYIETLVGCAHMYDLGSLSVPDRILLKPGRLDACETAIMRTHTTLGHAAIVRAEKTLATSSPLLSIAKDITLSHHERWNGTGYPQGLAGAQIPLAARIVAVADVYDALISNKVYKTGVSHEEALQIIFSERASHFDPDVVDAFIEVSPEFQAIAQRFADNEDDMQQKIEYLANAIAEQAEL